MRACILSIGDELIAGSSTDTNSGWIASRLARIGIQAVEFAVVPDDRAAIARALARLASLADAVISTGGLGPTADDLTRFGLGDVLAPSEELESDPVAVAHLETWFRQRSMPSANLVQALRPRGARFLPNGAGTAMGIAGETSSCMFFALPGPPREMKRMFEESVEPVLQARAGDHVILSEMVHEFGVGESDAATRLGAMMERGRQPLVGTTVSDAIVAARILSSGKPAQAKLELETAACEIERLWHPYAYGRTGATLEASVVQLLKQRDRQLATAESCTGGLLASMIVRIAGSSANFRGGWVTYSNDLKQRCLGVAARTLEQFGAVSREVAAEMAVGAMREAGAQLGVSVTGIAGPDGGTEQKPVGTVFVGLAQLEGGTISVDVRQFRFTGDRQIIRDRSAKSALQMLRFKLLGVKDAPLLWEVQQAKAWHRAAVAIGSNVGERMQHVNAAYDMLRQRGDVRHLKMSEVFETEPVGPPGQGNYLNAAMIFETTLSPRELLNELLSMERLRGRVREREPRNGARTLDLDLLMYSDLALNEPGLHLPHPRLHERRFVLEPFAQIAPNWVHPATGQSVESMLEQLLNIKR